MARLFQPGHENLVQSVHRFSQDRIVRARTPTAICVAALAWALGMTACVTQEEILSGKAGAGGARAMPAGAAAAAGAEPDAWTTDSCYEALARGADGDVCVGTFDCHTVVRSCCRSSVACSGGRLSLVERCDACDCHVDFDCPFDLVCVAGECVDCPPQEPCAFPLVQVLRDGCLSCSSAGDCSSDADCGASSICYAGRNCMPGCFGDPSCCSGNVCAAPGCGSAADLDCSIVGCDPGEVCDVNDARHFCACENGQWLCSIASRNRCVYP
jgi:hypothetical protein